MSFDHWKRLEMLVFGGEVAVDLPGQIRARRRGPVMQVGPA